MTNGSASRERNRSRHQGDDESTQLGNGAQQVGWPDRFDAIECCGHLVGCWTTSDDGSMNSAR